MNGLDFVRPELRDFRAYSAAEQVAGCLRLNANESSWVAETDSFARPLNRYPEIRPQRLRQLLAERYGCRPEELLVTRGSSEAIDLLIRVCCRAERDSIVTLDPGFSMYAHYARIQGAVVRQVTLDPEQQFSIRSDAILSAIDASTKIIFVCSPNNPTGTSIAAVDLETLLHQTRDRCLVVVDEAYIEFSERPSALRLRRQYPQLLVLRTLSKADALAGARCGSLIGDASLVSIVDAVQAPYALATPVAEYIEQALAQRSPAADEKRFAALRRERQRVADGLKQLSHVRNVWPSDANFLLLRADSTDDMIAAAKTDSILLRGFGGNLDGYVRISIGVESENDRLLECLQRWDSKP